MGAVRIPRAVIIGRALDTEPEVHIGFKHAAAATTIIIISAALARRHVLSLEVAVAQRRLLARVARCPAQTSAAFAAVGVCWITG